MDTTNNRKSINKKIIAIIILAAIAGIASVFTQIRFIQSKSLGNIKEKLETQISNSEQILNHFIHDTAFLRSELNNTVELPQYLDDDITNEEGLFVYRTDSARNHKLIFWNSTRFFFNEEVFNHPDTNFFIREINGDFEIVKKDVLVDGISCVCIGIIPVRWHYFIENAYLKSHFNNSTIPGNLITIKDEHTATGINSSNGKHLCWIDYVSDVSGHSLDILTVILRFGSIILLLMAFYLIAAARFYSKGFRNAISFLLICTAIVRTVIYVFPSMFYDKDMALFDPTVYGTDAFHPSLGQLLINVVFLASLLHFYNCYGEGFKVLANKKFKVIREVLKFLTLTITGAGFIYTIRHLIIDSKISFDVSNFSSLDYFSLLGFFIIVMLIVCYCQIILALYKKFIQQEWPFKPVSFYVMIMFIVTSVISLIIIHQNQLIEIEQRKKIAESLFHQEEEFGENMIQIAVANFNGNFLKENDKRFYNEKNNKYIKDSIIGVNFRGYLNRYDTKVYVFDSLHRNLYNDDTLQYNSLKEMITCNASYEGVEGLYSYVGKESSKNYIFQKNLIKGNDTTLYVFVLARLKANFGNAIFPELFKQSNGGGTEKNNNYFTAVYVNNYLGKHSTNFAFPNKINDDKLLKVADFKVVVSEDGMSELWYRASDNKSIVVIHKNDRIIDLLTLFSYLLCLIILINALYKLADKIICKIFPEIAHKKDDDFKYHFQLQIQNAITVISILSLTIIGIFTVTLFASRFKSSNNERLLKSVQSIVEEVESEIQSKLIYNDASNIHQLNEMDYIDKKIIQISEIHSVDINLFDAQGNLKLSTQPYIFNKHLLNDKINPLVFSKLKNNNLSSFIYSEKIGLLPYLSIYAVIRDENKKMIGFINIPYLNSQTELNAEVSNFLATLINLNTFIFLIAGAISFLVSRRITSSLVLIGNRMKEISLGNINEPISWNKNDEIGVLVKEYNKMVEQLDISARLLAKNEREIAWREMARQVAHEIKNPLTPMKLSLQYLQKAIDNGNDNIPELTRQVANTLIEQIDQLARIASDFSQFANIQNAMFEKFELFSSIDSVVNLYKMDTSVQFVWTKPKDTCYVVADKTQINRVLSNLIKNAIESGISQQTKEVTINCVVENKKVTISVTDNGEGIPDGLKDKIFEPNFTTKTSGTGLGLAICKSIVENVNGKIYFESNSNIKTTFYIQIPVAV